MLAANMVRQERLNAIEAEAQRSLEACLQRLAMLEKENKSLKEVIRMRQEGLDD